MRRAYARWASRFRRVLSAAERAEFAAVHGSPGAQVSAGWRVVFAQSISAATASGFPSQNVFDATLWEMMCEVEREKWQIDDLRSPSLALLSKAFNHSDHFLPATRCINLFSPHAHADLIVCVGQQEPAHEEVLHEQTNKHAAVAPVFLLW